jgi:hypothetical protein
MRHPLLRSTLVGVFALLVAGCSWFGGSKKLVCPGTVVAPSLDSATEFRPNSAGNANDIQFGVKILLVDSSCSADDKKGVTVDTRTTFIAARSDPSVNQRDFTYFVAIADAQRNILAKKQFSLRIEFPSQKSQMQLLDEITEQLPLRNNATAGNYVVIVGLELSPQQLEYNRSRQAQ